jgi:hypothetical protein
VQDSMLANVLGAYLDNIKEREFDLPLATLLHALGFHDVHFTHGAVEFGKDFIAKSNDEEGITLQYSFQSKAGDISQSDWRNDIMGQMLESLLVGLSHPDFDKSAPHQTVLVITGKLLGNAALGLQELNETIKRTYHKRPILFWDRETIIRFLETHGLGGVYHANAAGFKNYGSFYQLYGKILGGHVSQREIEQHSRQWLDEAISREKRLLCSAIESNIFAVQFQLKGFKYEAICSLLTLVRTVMHLIHTSTKRNEVEQLRQVYSQAISNLGEVIKGYLAGFKAIWDGSGNNLSSIIPGPNSIITYSIQCARVMELAGCLYFLEADCSARDATCSFLADFVSKEPGCANIPSDYYAVSLVLPVLSLCASGHNTVAEEVLHHSTVWICDRCQDGFGLADISADPYDEISTLFGYPFDFIKVQPRKSSFAASVICDLAAFAAKDELYTNIVNDVKAVKIAPQYWQVPDSASLFTLEGEDIVAYPNINYSDEHLPFGSFAFADHIKQEPRAFAITNTTGPLGPLLIMLLLRDRYFPTLWPLLTS